MYINPEVHLRKNLPFLKCADPCISDIITISSQVAAYKYCSDKQKWQKEEIEGNLFLCTRLGPLDYTFILLNQINDTNLLEPIRKEHDWEIIYSCLIYRNKENKIASLWFHNNDDCQNIYSRLQNIMKSLPSGTECREDSQEMKSMIQNARETLRRHFEHKETNSSPLNIPIKSSSSSTSIQDRTNAVGNEFISNFLTSTLNSMPISRTVSEEFERLSSIHTNSEESRSTPNQQRKPFLMTPSMFMFTKDGEAIIEDRVMYVESLRKNQMIEGLSDLIDNDSQMIVTTQKTFILSFSSPSTKFSTDENMVIERLTSPNLQKEYCTPPRNTSRNNDHTPSPHTAIKTQNTFVLSSLKTSAKFSTDDEMLNDRFTSPNLQKVHCTPPRDLSCHNISIPLPKTPMKTQNIFARSSSGSSTKFSTDSRPEDLNNTLRTWRSVRKCLLKHFGDDKENVPSTLKEGERKPFLMIPSMFMCTKDGEAIPKNKAMDAELLKKDPMIEVLCNFLDNDVNVITETQNICVRSSPTPSIKLDTDEKITNDRLTSPNLQANCTPPRNKSHDNVQTIPQTPKKPQKSFIRSSSASSTKLSIDSRPEDPNSTLKTLRAVRKNLLKYYETEKENIPLTPILGKKGPILMSPNKYMCATGSEAISENKTTYEELLRKDHMVKYLCDLLDNDLEVIKETQNTSVLSSPKSSTKSRDHISSSSPQGTENAFVRSSSASTKFITTSRPEDLNNTLKTLMAVRDCLNKYFGNDKENIPLSSNLEGKPFLMTPNMFICAKDGETILENRAIDVESSRKDHVIKVLSDLLAEDPKDDILKDLLAYRKYLRKIYRDDRKKISQTSSPTEKKQFLMTPGMFMYDEDCVPIPEDTSEDPKYYINKCMIEALNVLLADDPQDSILKTLLPFRKNDQENILPTSSPKQEKPFLMTPDMFLNQKYGEAIPEYKPKSFERDCMIKAFKDLLVNDPEIIVELHEAYIKYALE